MEQKIDEMLDSLQRCRQSLDNSNLQTIQKLFANDGSSNKQSSADEQLYKKCLEAVEVLNQLQQALTPPLHTLVDGFFGKCLEDYTK